MALLTCLYHIHTSTLFVLFMCINKIIHKSSRILEAVPLKKEVLGEESSSIGRKEAILGPSTLPSWVQGGR